MKLLLARLAALAVGAGAVGYVVSANLEYRHVQREIAAGSAETERLDRLIEQAKQELWDKVAAQKAGGRPAG